MQNALAGQRRGYNAGFTPPANVGGADPNIQRLLDSLISRTQANNTPQAWDGSGGSQAMVDAMKNQNTPTNTPNTPWTTGAWNIPGYGFGTSDEYDMNYLMYGLDQLGIYDQGQNTNYDPFNNEG